MSGVRLHAAVLAWDELEAIDRVQQGWPFSVFFHGIVGLFGGSSVGANRLFIARPGIESHQRFLKNRWLLALVAGVTGKQVQVWARASGGP